MPVEFAIWRLDAGATRLQASPLASESYLEELLAADISILGLDLLIVGRQVPTAYGKRIDLLGLDQEGTVHLIELKRDRTPREVVARALHYGSWVRGLTYEDITTCHLEYSGGQRLEEAFAERFEARHRRRDVL